MEESCNVTVVVLGDIGRSPRMQYHAASFLKEGYKVDLVGYSGSKPIEYLNSNNNCKINYLPSLPACVKDLPVLLAYLFKIVWQWMTLAWVLSRCRRPHHLLVQTPPAIPVLLVCWLYSRLVKANYVIDWHNYGYSIMALTHGTGHTIVRLSEKFEALFARSSDRNLCVTKAMKEDMKNRWNATAGVLYDRPPEHFGSITAEDREALVNRYSELSSAGLARTDRPALLISSTSWTEDEDFSILLSALKEYDHSEDTGLPRLVCVITGKGPLRDHYLARVAAGQWSRVTVLSLWLEAEDYPRLLACADLGVSLHSSSSGLDLPMKVVDMFGSGLPVAALHFNCLNELVRHKENGLVFHDSSELAEQLRDWFRGFPTSSPRDQFTKGIQEFQALRWHDNWTAQALPYFPKTR